MLDFNLEWHQDGALRSSFYDSATDRLVAGNEDIYGFTSMAVDTHVAIELARRLRAIRPNCVIVCGGAHFASIADAVYDLYGWIDIVITGEGEHSFVELLRRLSSTVNARQCAREFRTEQESIQRPRSLDWDSRIAYSLLDPDAYLSLNPARKFDVEGGRGCRYSCSFCYSPSHFSARRLAGAEQRLDELNILVSLGVDHVFFVEDNFLNDVDAAIQFCRLLRTRQLNLTWGCYGTLPQLRPHVLEAMASAGCTAVFTGVDAIGTVSQRTYKKAFAKSVDSLVNVTHTCSVLGIEPTLAFLTSPPGHPCGVDLEATVIAAMYARCAGAQVRLNTLAYYPGTAVWVSRPAFHYDNLRVRTLMDVPSVVEENDFARVNPELFPFHSRYVEDHEWHQYVNRIHALFSLLFARADVLRALWERHSLSPVAVADAVTALVQNAGTDPDGLRVQQIRAFDREFIA